MRQRKWLGIVFLLVIAACLAPDVPLADRDGKKKLEDWIKGSFHKGKIEYKDLVMGKGDFEARLTDVVITPDDGDRPLSIDRITIIQADKDHSPPHFLNLSAKGIHLKAEHFDHKVRKSLEANQIDQIPTDLDIHFRYDPEAGTLDLKNLTVQSEAFGKLSLAVAVDDIHLWSAEDKKTFLRFLVGVPQIALKSASVDYKDDGLIDLVIAHKAKESGKTEEEVLAQTFEEIDADIEKAQGETAKNNLIQVKKFLLDPGSLNITINPESPIKIKEMRKIHGNVMKTNPLGMTIKAK